MSDSTSTIAEMLADYEKVKKELKKLKKQTAATKVSCTKIEKRKNVRTCPICCQPPEVPVWWNGTRNGILEPCSASQANPGCLRCVRDYIQHAVDNNQEHIKCFAGCHYINIKRPKKWQLYGEMGRNANAHPCEALARALDDVGEGVTKCRKCGEECDSVWKLGMHIKGKCSHRLTTCDLCKKEMKIFELEEHRKTCYHVCNWCDENDDVEAGPIELKKDGTTDHYCPHKTLAKCRVCQKPITMNNIETHKNCSLAKKGDVGVCKSKERDNNCTEDIISKYDNIEELSIWTDIGDNEFYRLLCESNNRGGSEVYDVVDRRFRNVNRLPPFTDLSSITSNNEQRYYNYDEIYSIVRYRDNYNQHSRAFNRFGPPISAVTFP